MYWVGPFTNNDLPSMEASLPTKLNSPPARL